MYLKGNLSVCELEFDSPSKELFVDVTGIKTMTGNSWIITASDFQAI